MGISKVGRKRTGSLYWTKSGWRARITVDVNGVPTQKSYNLHTESRAEAERKLNDLTALTRAREATDDELKAKVALTHAEFKRHRTALDAFETLSVRIDRLEQLIEQMISGGDK